MADEDQQQLQHALDAEMAEAVAEDDDDSSSSSSDGSEGFREVEVSAEDAAALMRLEAELADNPALYDSHVQVGRPGQGPATLGIGMCACVSSTVSGRGSGSAPAAATRSPPSRARLPVPPPRPAPASRPPACST